MSHIFHDILNDTRLTEIHSLANGISDGIGVGGAMSLDHRLLDADQGGTAYLVGAHQLFELLQLILYQNRCDFGL